MSLHLPVIDIVYSEDLFNLEAQFYHCLTLALTLRTQVVLNVYLMSKTGLVVLIHIVSQNTVQTDRRDGTTINALTIAITFVVRMRGEISVKKYRDWDGSLEQIN